MDKKYVDIVLVVDYQNDFVSGSLGFDRAIKLDDGICAETQRCLDEGGEVIATLDTHYADYMTTREGANLPVLHTVMGTAGHLLYGNTGRYLVDQIRNGNEKVKLVRKTTFGSEELIQVVRNKIKMIRARGDEVRSVRLMGVVTNICVISNAVATVMAVADLKPIVEVEVLANLCGSNDIELHNKALDVMESFQVKVINRG